MFKNLDTVILYVRNIAKAKEFYTKKLGFILDYENGDYVCLKISKKSKTRIALNAYQKVNHYPGHQTIVLKAKKIETAYRDIKDKGVNILAKLTIKSWGKTFTFTDPDGNKIEVI